MQKQATFKRWNLEALALFSGFVPLIYGALYRRNNIAEGDTLYHFKIASLILERGPWVDISWLPFTVLGVRGTDHQWLWHLLLAPFTLIHDPWQGILVASAVTCALVAAVALLVFRGLAVPYAPFFAILMVAGGPGMPERLTRLRSENIAYAFLAIAFLCLVKRRYIGLALLSFLFMEAYHGAVLLIPLVLIFSLVALIKTSEKSLWSIIAVLGGMTAGLIFSPWFPENVSFLFFHALFKLGSENGFLIGTEWLKPSWLQILRFSWVNHVLLALALLIFFIRHYSSRPAVQLTNEAIAALLLTAMSLFMYHDALRNAAYYNFFTVLTSAILWRDANIQHQSKRSVMVSSSAAVLVSIALISVGTRQIIDRPGQIDSHLSKYQHIVNYLVDHSKPGDIVFNVVWFDFVTLFWQSDKLRYVNGLDGNFLAYGDPKRFKVWYDILQGGDIKVGTSILLQKTFNTEWVVVPRSEGTDKIAMAIIDGGNAETTVLDQDGWLIHLATPTSPLAPTLPERTTKPRQ